MAWSGVITNAGAAMLNQLAAGEHVLHIDSAKVGSGTTAAENMRSATALNTQKDSASILSSRVTGNRVQIKVQVGPNVSAGYTAHEIGVWAHVDSGASALFALHQDTGDGVAIPSTVENPDFAFALYIVFAAANTASIAVTVDTSATVSESTMAEALEDYATKAELAAAEEALSEVATSGANGMMSATDKAKLDGIAAQANKYVHPADKTASTGVPTANQTPGFGATFNVDQIANDNNGHVTGHTTRTVKIPDTAATQSAAGLMPAEDKAKVNKLSYTLIESSDTTPWKTAGGTSAHQGVRVVRNQGDVVWAVQQYSSAIAFGENDTHGYIGMGHSAAGTGQVSFAGGSTTNSTDAAPNWYWKIKGTNGASYTLPGSSKTLASTDAATEDAAGLMSAEDKGKLDDLASDESTDLASYVDTSKFTLVDGSIRKIGKLVCVTIKGSLKDAAVGTSAVIINLPASYRPTAHVYGICCGLSMASSTAPAVGLADVNEDGEVNVEINNKSVQFSFTYFAA